MSEDREYLDIKATIQGLRDQYTSDLAQGSLNALIVGEMGSGKTHLLKTARKPVLVYSFDPGGTKTLRSEIKRGEIVPVTSMENEAESMKHDRAWKDFESTFERHRRKGVFNHIGTVAIDSFTTALHALIRSVAVRENRDYSVLAIQDWQVVGNVIRDLVKVFTNLPCDFICTAHVDFTKDEVAGGLKSSIKAPPSLKIDLPLLFDEIYFLESREVGGQISRKLITQNTGKFECRTRIGSDGRFEVREDPNIKDLLKKAGINPADKDLMK